MRKAHGGDKDDARKIHENGEHIRAILTYIKDTGRLKNAPNMYLTRKPNTRTRQREERDKEKGTHK